MELDLTKRQLTEMEEKYEKTYKMCVQKAISESTGSSGLAMTESALCLSLDTDDGDMWRGLYITELKKNEDLEQTLAHIKQQSDERSNRIGTMKWTHGREISKMKAHITGLNDTIQQLKHDILIGTDYKKKNEELSDKVVQLKDILNCIRDIASDENTAHGSVFNSRHQSLDECG